MYTYGSIMYFYGTVINPLGVKKVQRYPLRVLPQRQAVLPLKVQFLHILPVPAHDFGEYSNLNENCCLFVIVLVYLVELAHNKQLFN